jgi:hypothetical protein
MPFSQAPTAGLTHFVFVDLCNLGRIAASSRVVNVNEIVHVAGSFLFYVQNAFHHSPIERTGTVRVREKKTAHSSHVTVATL